MVVDPHNTVDGSDDNESESSDGDMNCPHCNKRFDKQDRFDRHLQIHTQDGPFPCDYCSAVEKDKASLKMHWRKEHSENKAHMCQACGEAFSRREDLVKHNIRHDKIKPYPCKEPSCNKAFAYRSDLRKHLVIHTGGYQIISLCFCSCSFVQKDKLLRHEKLHKGERPHTCYECPTSFHRKEELTKHIQFHHYSPVNNTPSNGKDSETEDVIISVDPSHWDGANHPCDICHKVFRQPYELMKHKLKHGKSKDFICDVCTKGFHTRRELTRHANIHSDIRPFSCVTCGKAFSRKDKLTRHMKIHVTIVPACKICKKTYSSQQELTRHLYTHSANKPYQCEFCTSSYCRKDKLVKHIKKAHPQSSSESGATI
uniref:C2H2-type domain-containing protein n=1 Tax=Rhodnius prolixus TaxID=13249 RepID=T1IC24_RHOPR